MIRYLKVRVCIAYGNFLVAIRPIMDYMPLWLQRCYVMDLEDMTEYILKGGK